MQFTFALAALAAVAYASPAPQVTAAIAPTGSAPAGFQTSYSGTFQITAVNVSSLPKREVSKRAACGTAGSLTLTLANGVLTDGEKRVGYIASNYQFQFDLPPQTGAIYTTGWSVGANNSLALGASAVFYQCLSGSFYNLYDRAWAPQCVPVIIEVLPCSSSGGGAVTQLTDGQPQAPTSTSAPCAVTQIKDGQVQISSCTVTPTKAPVTQISDGQVQIPTSIRIPITQISDGQIQAPPITQISDGQIQAPTQTPTTKAPISQISDGQIQAPTQTPTSTKVPISQITDGQIQAPTGASNATATASKTPVPFTGGAGMRTLEAEFAAAVVGLAAVLLL
ncbi:hypothetical protein BP5796_09503 [Coleophoma crateriformis]|uniref:Cell wall mannoprotein PIR1-like C-terminal domain-containing protein n=1 Tax=Coleophoma crateriformis TaxID=565419 RepID=A0A3D8QYW9_9HELO|nr:hypothetical protein BP5796_09503 [Coleophoma crateriformis]